MIQRISAAVREMLQARRHARQMRRLPPLNEPRAGYERRAGTFIHPTAVISPEAELGSGVVIGPFAVIEGQTRIGDRSQIASHCVIKRFTSMGTGNRIHEGAVLGGDPQDLGFAGEESHVVIGNDNVIREGVTIHRAVGAGRATVVGNRNYLMCDVHLAHNCVIGDRVGIVNGTGLIGHVRVDDDAFISGHVGILGRCRIGRAAMVGAASKVTQDVPPFCNADGDPAVLVGLNRKGLASLGLHGAEIGKLKHAYWLLTAERAVSESTLEEMASLCDPLVDELVTFVRGSTRGLCPSKALTRALAKGSRAL